MRAKDGTGQERRKEERRGKERERKERTSGKKWRRKG